MDKDFIPSDEPIRGADPRWKKQKDRQLAQIHKVLSRILSMLDSGPVGGSGGGGRPGGIPGPPGIAPSLFADTVLNSPAINPRNYINYTNPDEQPRAPFLVADTGGLQPGNYVTAYRTGDALNVGIYLEGTIESMDRQADGTTLISVFAIRGQNVELVTTYSNWTLRLGGRPGQTPVPVGFSTSTQTVGTGLKYFDVPLDPNTALRSSVAGGGIPVLVTVPGNPSVRMYGTTGGDGGDPGSYTITVNVTSATGSGTFSNWQISVVGEPGVDGADGEPGPTGPAGTITSASATMIPAGSTPTVTLGGTPSARTFAFGIPEALDDSGWIAVTPISPWNVELPVAYRKIGPFVYIRGRVNGTPSTANPNGSGRTVFTLPAGFRPAADGIKWVGDGTAAAATNARLVFQADGVVQAIIGQRPNFDDMSTLVL